MTETANQMFCFQCEQTAGCIACVGAKGTCGKTASVSELQDRLTGALVGLARATEGNEAFVNERTDSLTEKALFATLTNVNFSEESLNALLAELAAEKNRLVAQCETCTNVCGRNDDFDMNELWNAQKDVRSLKSLLLFGIRGIAAYAYHVRVLGRTSRLVDDFLYEALFAIGMDGYGVDELLPLVMKAGEVNYVCMELLDEANTQAFGTPSPVTVELGVEAGPFIIVSGHDLFDLKLLLDQTQGAGVNIYTHGEMLPAHGYPGLKKFPHLVGNFGTAWQSQQKEFENALLRQQKEGENAMTAEAIKGVFGMLGSAMTTAMDTPEGKQLLGESLRKSQEKTKQEG